MQSATNAHYSELRSLLRNGSSRRNAGAFVVEGPVLVAELLASPLEVRYVVGIEELLEVHASSGVDLLSAHPGKLADALSTKTPRLIAAVASIPDRAAMPEGGSLALIDISDPGNAGTMMRTAEAAGMGSVLLVGDCVDPWNPKVIRASAGAALRVPVLRMTYDELFESNQPILATVVGEATNYLQAPLAEAIVCVGNEAHGLHSEFVQRCSDAITIPLAGPTESLNVAAAAAIVVFAALEQRRAITLAGE